MNQGSRNWRGVEGHAGVCMQDGAIPSTGRCSPVKGADTAHPDYVGLLVRIQPRYDRKAFIAAGIKSGRQFLEP